MVANLCYGVFYGFLIHEVGVVFDEGFFCSKVNGGLGYAIYFLRAFSMARAQFMQLMPSMFRVSFLVLGWLMGLPPCQLWCGWKHINVSQKDILSQHPSAQKHYTAAQVIKQKN